MANVGIPAHVLIAMGTVHHLRTTMNDRKYIIRHDIRLEDHNLTLRRLQRILGTDVVALISKSISYGIPIGAYHKQLQDIKETDHDITRV